MKEKIKDDRGRFVPFELSIFFEAQAPKKYWESEGYVFEARHKVGKK